MRIINITALLLLVFLYCGCTGKRDVPGVTQASDATNNEHRVIDDATRTKAEGTAAGVVGGAGTRVLVKSVPGGKIIKRMARYGIGLTETLGGVGGHLLGSTIADRKQYYLNEEERLNGEINIFHQLNKKLSGYNSVTLEEIAALRNQIGTLQQVNSEKKQQVAFTARAKESFVKKIALDKATMIRLAHEFDDLTEYYNSIQVGNGGNPQVIALRQEMVRLQQHMVQFESNNRELDRLVASVPVRD